MKYILSKLYWVVLFIIIVLAVAVSSSLMDMPGGYALFTVQSGSMEPAVKKGALVLIQPQETYKKSDIITFHTQEKKSQTVTHRIHEVQIANDNQAFMTKGDANDSVDSTPILPNAILGKVIFSIPYLGYPIAFARTQIGLIILIVIPGTIIIYSELMTIKNEAARLIKERRNRKLTTLEKVEVAVGSEVKEVEKEVKEAEKVVEKQVRKVIKKRKKKKKIKS